MPFLNSKDLLWEELASIAQDESLHLYDAERVSAGVLRVYIDKPRSRFAGEIESVPGEAAEMGGVTSGDCTRLCRRLMVFFAAEGPRFGLLPEPEIEVSSPGVNRELRLPDHFEQAVGKRIKVVARNPAESKKAVVIGVLTRIVNDQIEVVDEETEDNVFLPLSEIKRANAEYKFG